MMIDHFSNEMRLFLFFLIAVSRSPQRHYAAGSSYFDTTGSVFNYDAYGIRFALNEQYSVLIQNDLRQFIVSFAPYSETSANCTFSYQYPGYEFMYMVAVTQNITAGGRTMRFVNIGESFQVICSDSAGLCPSFSICSMI